MSICIERWEADDREEGLCRATNRLSCTQGLRIQEEVLWGHYTSRAMSIIPARGNTLASEAALALMGRLHSGALKGIARGIGIVDAFYEDAIDSDTTAILDLLLTRGLVTISSYQLARPHGGYRIDVSLTEIGIELLMAGA